MSKNRGVKCRKSRGGSNENVEQRYQYLHMNEDLDFAISPWDDNNSQNQANNDFTDTQSSSSRAAQSVRRRTGPKPRKVKRPKMDISDDSTSSSDDSSSEESSSSSSSSDEDDRSILETKYERKAPQTGVSSGMWTISDILVGIFAWALYYRVVIKCLEHVLQLLSITASLFIPTTISKLLTAMNWKASTHTRQFYCRTCTRHFGVKKPTDPCPTDCCVGKPSKIANFIQFKLYPQLKQLLKRPYIQEALKYRQYRIKKNSDAIEDIYDGEIYQKLSSPGKFLSHKYNYSFSLYVGESSLPTNSTKKVWSLFVQINELPPYMRKKHLLLAGNFCDTEMKDMNLFLQECLNELNRLYREGIDWKHASEGNVTSRFVLLNFTADSKTRLSLLNMKTESAFGCVYCDQRGCKDEKSSKDHIYPLTRGVKLRTDQGMRENMTFGSNSRLKSKLGVHGSSFLRTVPLFDLINSAVVDVRSCGYLEVVKKHTTLLLNARKHFWLIEPSQVIPQIDKRLLNVIIPACVSSPRSIRQFKTWTDLEWRNWLLYFCVPCLAGILRPQFLRHLGLLSQALYIFELESIDKSDMALARISLKNYVQLFQRYFGRRNMIYDVHLLGHLARSIELWGPSWSNSSFVFNSWYNQILGNLHGHKSSIMDFVTRYLMVKHVATGICDEELCIGTKKTKYVFGLFPTLKISSKSIVDLSNTNYAPNFGKLPAELLKRSKEFFYQASYKGFDYTVQRKKTGKYCNNSFVYVDELGFAEVVAILKLFDRNQEPGLVIKLWKTVNNTSQIRHLCKIEPTKDVRYVNFSDFNIWPVVIALRSHDLSCYTVVKIPNLWESAWKRDATLV